MISEINRYGSCSVSEPLTQDELMRLAADKNVKLIAISGLSMYKFLTNNSWKSLNDIVFRERKDIRLSIQDFDLKECDLSFASLMTNVEIFFIDRIRYCKGIEQISQMKNLKYLRIVLPELDSYDFLLDIGMTVEKLVLQTTSSKKIDLGFLKNFNKLKTLEIEQIKFSNIEAISSLVNLQELTLSSLIIKDLGFLSELKELWSLKILFSSVGDFSKLEGMGNIKYLMLYKMKKLYDVSYITHLIGLQYLHLESLPQISNLPDFTKLEKLRRIVINNCKNICDYSVLNKAKSLEDIGIIGMKQSDPETFKFVTNIPNVKKVAIWFETNRKRDLYQDMMRNYEVEVISPYSLKEFEFMK